MYKNYCFIKQMITTIKIEIIQKKCMYNNLKATVTNPNLS